MEQIGIKFSSGHMLVTLDPDNKKVNVTANIKNTAYTGDMKLKPVKAVKENR